MIQPPDWQEVEELLFEKGKEALLRFATEHSALKCSFFAYYTNPIAGEFKISFDTIQHALQQAREEELRTRQKRQKWWDSQYTPTTAWHYARSYLDLPRLTDYSPEVGYFHFASHTTLTFENWTIFFDSDSYPERLPGIDDYLVGNTRVVLWKVIERLITEGTVFQMNLSPLFRLGYQFYDEELVVLRILNWPGFLDQA